MRTLAILAVLVCALAPAAAEPVAVPLAKVSGRVGQMGKNVVKKLKTAYQVDGSDVPTVVLDNHSFDKLFRTQSGKSPKFVLAFHSKGTIYVRKSVFRLTERVLLHELLHALSPRFTEEAAEDGLRNLVEGTTDYLTHQIYPPPRGVRGRPRSAYGHYERFVALVVARVGAKFVADCYFKNGYDALEKAVDAQLQPGALRTAASHLEVDDPVSAEKALAGPPRKQ